MAGSTMRLGIEVDTDTRATRQEFTALRRDIKAEADAMGGDWEAAAAKVEQALEEAGARTDLIDAARKIGQDGPTEIERMRSALRDTGDEARTLGDAVDDAARQISESFESNAITAEDVLGAEVRAEILSNAAEAGAEITRGLKDGFSAEDVETIVDGITDTIVSIGAVGGPAGIAAGLAGASLVQLLVGPFITKSTEAAEQFEETFSTAFDNVLEHGREVGRELTISAAVDEFVKDTDKLNEATESANQLGVERGVVLRAMAGDQDALNYVTEKSAEKVADATKAQEDAMAAADGSAESSQALSDAQTNLLNVQADVDGATRNVTDAYNTNSDALAAATEASEAKGDADAWAANKAIENAHAMAESTGKAQELEVTIKGVTREIKVMPDGKTIDVTDDGSAKKTQGRIDGIDGKRVIVPVDVDSSNVDRYITGLSGRRPVLNVDVRYRRVGGPTP